MPKATEREAEVVQMLCPADDEDPEESTWKDIYQRLRSDKRLDLQNTRPDIRPVFTSLVNDRPTRITSANFSPHAVVLNKDGMRPHSVISTSQEYVKDDVGLHSEDDEETERTRESVGLTFEGEKSESVLTQNSDEGVGYFKTRNNSVDSSTFCQFSCDYYEQNTAEETGLEESSGVSVNIEGPRVDGDDDKWGDDDFEDSMAENVLSSSSKSFGYLSPQPCCGALNPDKDENWDPFDGLGIPRERASSFGSLSIVSVKDFKDELYNEYFYEIRRCIRNYGYFEKFPSPTLLRDAQRTYRHLNLPTPVNDDGKVLPHPPKESRDGIFGEKDFSCVDQRAMFVSI